MVPVDLASDGKLGASDAFAAGRAAGLAPALR